MEVSHPRMQPVGGVSGYDTNVQLPQRELRSSIVIEGKENDSVHLPVADAEEDAEERGNMQEKDDKENLKEMYMDAKVEMLGIIKEELELKLEMRAIKEQFLELLITYSNFECDSSDIMGEVFPRAKTPEPEDEHTHLEESICHDSSTIVYSTDACYQDSSTVEETPTNRKMPRERYLLLNEDGSRALPEDFDSPPTWVRGIRPIANDPLLQSRRRSLKLAYPITMKEANMEKDTDNDERDCISRGPTFPGGDSIKSSGDASPDFSMEVMKDSDFNQSELTTPSSDGIRSSDVTNASLPGFSPSNGLNESSYKESDAAWSPDGASFTSASSKQPATEDKSFELTLSRKKNNKRLLMEKMTRQISGATCSSTNSDLRLPNAPMNSPNSTAVSQDYLINDITGSSFSNIQSISQCHEMTTSNFPPSHSQIQLPILEEVCEERCTPDYNEFENQMASESFVLNDPNADDEEKRSLDSEIRLPCIGEENAPKIITTPVPINLPPKPEKKQTKFSNRLSQTPLGKTLSAVKRSGSFTFRKNSKTTSNVSSKESLNSASSWSTGTASTASGSLDSMPESVEGRNEYNDKENIPGMLSPDEQPLDEASYKKLQKSTKKSKKFPVLQRIQSLKKHFKSGQKTKSSVAKE